MSVLIACEGVSVRFADATVLEQVDLAVSEGEVVTLIGPNGSGKTTLIHVLMGLLKPNRGSVWRASDLNIGYVPQKLVVDYTMPLSVARFLSLGSSTAKKFTDVAHTVGIENLLDRQIHHVSGGEMQRILLARALLKQPNLMVLDEPAQGVDFQGQSELYHLIGEIKKTWSCAVLMVSHDLHFVMSATDRVICLNHHVCCSGQPESVTLHPEYQRLFGNSKHNFAIYNHHHDHYHDLHGNVIGPKP
ncbi:MAG: metal ABC transporter ATP-binding protein [Gammaproteobacteria bacterium]|nr:metal ABC transporter ATP-binding protein [Gammaproteobacteria bacterium]